MYRKNLIGYAAAPVAIALVTTFYSAALRSVNATTVALSLLLVVLVVASAYGLGPGILGSVLGMLCFNFFFLPPVGTLTIQDPQNWVALFAFLVTAVIASQLSAAARNRANEADKRRAEVWRLYQLSRAIIATPDSETAIASIARQVVDAFGFDYCAVFLPKQNWTRVAVGGDYSTPIEQSAIEQAFKDSDIRQARQGSAVIYAPLKVGVKPIGVLAVSPSDSERATIEAIAGLVALALERARFLTEVGSTEALRKSDEFKSALLASISHDLRTPLTSIRAAVDSLLEDEISWDQSAMREFHTIISEEVARLTRLVDNLLEMARIEAGELKLLLRWESISEIISNVLLRCESSLRDFRVKVDAGEDHPLVYLDSRLIAEALSNLVENAAKYSPPGSQITIKARVQNGELVFSVTDEGIGILPGEIERVFDKFYRGTSPRGRQTAGTGMGLAIAKGVIQAHGGRIWVDSRYEHGATFSFAIPVEVKSAETAISSMIERETE
jgi:two-component system sensor histidine kinase KdpD